jgi:hypothetical protein
MRRVRATVRSMSTKMPPASETKEENSEAGGD